MCPSRKEEKPRARELSALACVRTVSTPLDVVLTTELTDRPSALGTLPRLPMSKVHAPTARQNSPVLRAFRHCAPIADWSSHAHAVSTLVRRLHQLRPPLTLVPPALDCCSWPSTCSACTLLVPTSDPTSCLHISIFVALRIALTDSQTVDGLNSPASPSSGRNHLLYPDG